MQKLFLKETLKFAAILACCLMVILLFVSSIDSDNTTKTVASTRIDNCIDTVNYDIAQSNRLHDLYHNSTISKVKSFAFIIANDPSILTDQERLNQLKIALDVDEFCVTDEKGVIRWGTHYIGYDLRSAPQSAAFLPGLDNKSFILSQELMPRGANGQVFQYTGVSRIDAPGVVQVGVDIDKTQRYLSITNMANISKLMPILGGGFIMLADKESKKIISHRDDKFIGKYMAELGFNPDYPKEENKLERINVDGEYNYVIARSNGKYLYVGLIPYSESNKVMFYNVIVSVISVLITLIVVQIITIYIVRKKLINGISYIINSLSRITKGDLSTRVSLDTCEEFTVLSKSINDMVAYLTLLLENETELSRQTVHLASIKNQFLAKMSHEIRTPLNVIIGMTQVGISSLENQDKILNSFKDIKLSSEHLLSIINDILDMAKIESGKLTITPETFIIDEDVNNVVLMIKSYADEKSQELRLTKEGIDGIAIFADKLRLNQIFLNLLSNAMKFTPDGGLIELIIRCVKKDDSSVTIYFAVKDNGIGMDEEEIASIFLPFQQADDSITRRFGGTGLGLTISQNIAHMMGGGISIESEKGKGATFFFTLTFQLADYDECAIQSKAADKDVKYPDLSQYRMLLTDDVSLNRRVIIELLARTKIHITEASDGKVAYETFKKSEINHFDIILMDIHMPEMDGYMATEAIRNLDRTDAEKVPIIAVTADAFKDNLEKILNSSMSDMISKPIDYIKLLGVLIKYLK